MMGVPHLFQPFVDKGGASGQKLVAADGEGVLIAIAAGIAFPLFGRHISGGSRDFAQRGMCLHA